jgi:hypothetical protein
LWLGVVIHSLYKPSLRYGKLNPKSKASLDLGFDVSKEFMECIVGAHVPFRRFL